METLHSYKVFHVIG